MISSMFHCRPAVKPLILLAFLFVAPSMLRAQVSSDFTVVSEDSASMLPTDNLFQKGFRGKKKEKNLFNRLDVALTLGTTGIGFDVASPIGNYLQVRAGYAFMPSFKHTMNFKLQVGDKPETQYDKNGNKIQTKFDRLAARFKEITGQEVDNEIDMIGRPVYSNGKLLFDVFPFHNKKWFFTAGVYYGPATIAKSYNTYEDMPALFAVKVYNSIYEKVLKDEALITTSQGEIIMPDDLAQKMKKYGRMGIHLGDYFLVPDENSMVKATVEVDHFKPYLGFGYGNAVPRTGQKYAYMLECGFMLWGGTPKVMCYGTDLATQHVKGKVGRDIDFIKAFKVFPVINLRITRRLF